MKTKTQKLAATFGSDTRFEVKPAVATFRVTQETELERLKNRLLLQLLNENPEPDANAPLRRAANDAAALAWATQFPLLFFPTLLEEKASLARRQARKQREILARTEAIFAQAA
jgi:hypothetical protein